ncbi:MAG: aminotransferase class V-fold PLP-dependent enzyme [Gammaproteobacteria bacterium]|jgi:selenocysteine lyase/cysteine desulfurase
MSNPQYSEEFPQREDIIYLNHAAVAPWPRRAALAVARFAEENASQGALDYARWLQVEASLRLQCQELLNAPSVADIALLKNTSEALSTVAYGLSWNVGDNVVFPDQEFPSNRIVWESLRQFGVGVRKVSLEQAPSPEDALMGACDRSTRLLAVSSVQYATGLRLDLERLGHYCHKQGILLCVDAIQSLGALRMDVQASGADFVMADGHKWLLGPEGVALFYCRPERREALNLVQYGWHMVAHVGDFERADWQLADSAQRFECGSLNMLGIHALNASLSLLLEVGLENVEDGVLRNTEYLSEAIRCHPQLELISPDENQRQSGIVSFRCKSVDPGALFSRLTSAGVVCALRNRSIRFSPHFYTSRAKLEMAMELVSTYCGE